MPHCPSCKAEIDHLDTYTDERHYFHARLTKDSDEQDIEVSTYKSGLSTIEVGDTKTVDGGYSCPVCMAQLAVSESYAVELLKEE